MEEFSADVVNSLDDKEALVAYAEQHGIEPNKRLGVTKLKQAIIIEYNSKFAIDVDTLLDRVEEETKEQDEQTSEVIDGAASIDILKGGKVVESVTDAGLILWCEEHKLNYATVEGIIDRTWVNHEGYSFKRIKH